MKYFFDHVGRFLYATDKALLFTALCLSSLSVLLLFGINSAGYVMLRSVWVQIIAAVLGVAGAILAGCLDYDELARLWKFYVPPVLLLVIATYFFGVEREGSSNRSWLVLFGVSIQPTEFLKIAFILTFALHLSKAGGDLNRPRVLLPVLLHGAVPVLLTLLQHDWGVAVIMLCIVCSMLFAAGLSGRIVAAAVGSLVLVAPFTWFVLFSDFQRQRFLAILDPTLDPLGTAYQQLRGVTAIGSGQIFGIGLFSQDHLYVPESYNDFIFTFLGESFGFIGCLLVIAALGFICLRVLAAGMACKNGVGKCICAGVFAMIAFQSIVNIGMCLMVTPVIGVTLPLVSQGGSSVLSVYAGLGLVLSVCADNNKSMFMS